MRVSAVLFMVAGGLLIVAAVAQEYVDAIMLICGAVCTVMGWFCWWRGVDAVVREAERQYQRQLEERRRRGAAGWHKRVRPPRDQDRPGGLPPRG